MNEHDSDDDRPRLVPAAPVDASLDARGQGGTGAVVGPADDAFPETAEGPWLVLFQRADGAVELRWRLDLAALEHARAAFGDGGGPHARLLLKAVADGGRLIAQARLTHAELVAKDTALYDAERVEGPLQAEIGLGDEAGGWMLIARSNRLDASGPVGAGLLRDADEDGAAAAAVEEQTAQTAADETASAVPETAPPTPARPPALPDQVPVAAPLLARAERADVADETPPARHSEAAAGETDTAPPALGAEPPEPAGPASPERRQAAPAGPDARAAILGGSGPIRPPDPDQGVELQAELVLRGRAPPGQVVELGGHEYRVGDGGRFVLRIPVSDRELIQAALAQLADLPVAHRDAGGDPSASS